MELKKTSLSTAIAIAMGGASFTASASLTASATLNFTLGTVQTASCTYGTTPPCNKSSYAVTDIIGSYFAFDGNGSNAIEPFEKLGISSFNGIHIGTVQDASGSHSGQINGTENPNIDNPWMFKAVGMHETTSPITVNGGSGDNLTLDMSGWGYTWNGIPHVSMVQTGAANISCTSGSSCSDSSNYTLDAAFHITGSGGFTTVPYALHLEGQISSVPIPAAAWLFVSGFAGLMGAAQRRKS